MCEPGVDPRIARTRAAVLRAATDLLVEGGTNAVTIDAIVTRSGVAKSTIYRHWNSRDEVLLSVIESCAPHIEVPDESLPFEAALRLLLNQLARTLGDPEWARVVPALAALRNQDHGIAQLEQRIEAKQEDALDSVLRRGVDEGRLRPDIDLDRAAAVLVGPLLFASLVEKPAVDDALGEHVVDLFLRTHAA
jgi:TetR/AcrR family transcriptional regulator of autoinduction and epiphytic fitness